MDALYSLLHYQEGKWLVVNQSGHVSKQNWYISLDIQEHQFNKMKSCKL